MDCRQRTGTGCGVCPSFEVEIDLRGGVSASELSIALVLNCVFVQPGYLHMMERALRWAKILLLSEGFNPIYDYPWVWSLSVDYGVKRIF